MNRKLRFAAFGGLAVGIAAAFLAWTPVGHDRKYVDSEIRADGSSAVRETGPRLRHSANRESLEDARALLRRREYRKAEQVYREILAKTPDESSAAHELGSVLFFQGRYDESRAAYEALLQRDPKFYPARNGLGAVARVQGRFPDAIEQFSLAIQADPRSALAHYGRGASYFHLGKLDEAQADLDKTVALLPKEAPLVDEANQLIDRIKARRSGQKE